MIKLEDPGERGESLTIKLSIFDVLSLQEMCTVAFIHYNERLDAISKKTHRTPLEDDLRQVLANKIQDARVNLAELEQIQSDRNTALKI